MAHDFNLVALSVVIAMAASYAALDISRRIAYTQGLRRLAWISASALVLGGGIWSMHFVAMLAMIVDQAVDYHLGLTILSLVLALGLTGIGFYIVSRQDLLAWGRIALAGVVIGLGVSAMHYTGMAGMIIDARIHYDPLLVAASVLIGLTAATVAMYLTVNPPSHRWQPVAALVMGFAISGLHYTGMAALELGPANDTGIATMPGLLGFSAGQGERLSGINLALGVAGVTGLLLVVSLVAAAVDRRLVAKMQHDQQIMAATNEQLRRLIETSGAIPWQRAAEDHRYSYVGPQAEAILGYSLEEWLAPDFRQRCIHPEDRDFVRAETTRALAEGANHEVEYRMLAADGRAVWLRDIVNVETGPEGTQLRGFLFDITESKERERHLDQARLEAERASAAKSAFLANMSHELRTPLNAIIGFSDILRGETFGGHSSPRYKEYSQDIHDSAQHLLSIISDLLTLARLNASSLEIHEERVDLAQIASSVQRMLHPIAEQAQVTLEVPLARGSLILRGDERSLKQLLVNLVSNAIKFTQPGGRVRVYASEHFDNGDLQIVVEDTGIGIAAEQIDQVMEPFQQAESTLSRSYQGVGLGLPLARGFAELHGGRLHLESRPGEGTRASVTLPAQRLVARPIEAA